MLVSQIATVAFHVIIICLNPSIKQLTNCSFAFLRAT